MINEQRKPGETAEARALGKFLNLTEAMRAATGTTTIASVDATAEQQARWAQEFIRMLLWTECTQYRKCGHVATGPLAEYTPEDATRWGAQPRSPRPCHDWHNGTSSCAIGGTSSYAVPSLSFHEESVPKRKQDRAESAHRVERKQGDFRGGAC